MLVIFSRSLTLWPSWPPKPRLNQKKRKKKKKRRKRRRRRRRVHQPRSENWLETVSMNSKKLVGFFACAMNEDNSRGSVGKCGKTCGGEGETKEDRLLQCHVIAQSGCRPRGSTDDYQASPWSLSGAEQMSTCGSLCVSWRKFLTDFTFATFTKESSNAQSKTSWSKLLTDLRGSSGFFFSFSKLFLNHFFFHFTMVIKRFRELRVESAKDLLVEYLQVAGGQLRNPPA